MNNSNPLVSVVIPCYNHENFVQDSIQSVIDQGYENIELIIIDDGSQDGSVIKIQEMVESCKERFIRFEFRSRANVGLSTTLNEALEWCEGKYFSAIASDDQMLQDKTAIQVSFMEKNIDSVAVFGGVYLIDSNSAFINKRLNKNKKYTFKEIIMHEHDLPAPTQMIRLNKIKEVGGYNSNLLIEDWYMWLKLSMNGSIYYINHIFCLYRQHDNNMSKNIVKIQQGRLDVLFLFKDNMHYKKALCNIRWLNAVESSALSNNKNIKKIFRVFLTSPKKTGKAIFKKIKL